MNIAFHPISVALRVDLDSIIFLRKIHTMHPTGSCEHGQKLLWDLQGIK